MIPKQKAVARTLAIAIAGAMLGCLPTKKADVRQDARDGGVTPASFTVDANKPPADAKGGDVGTIAVKRCGLSIAILSRPAKDPALNEALWHAADEQAIPVEALRTLEANGLRVGLITGPLPVEVEAVLNPPPPGQKVQVVSIDQPDGEPTSIDLSAASATTTLLLNRDGRTFGKDYDDAKGLLRPDRRPRLVGRGPAQGRARDPSRPDEEGLCRRAGGRAVPAARVHDEGRPVRGDLPRAGGHPHRPARAGRGDRRPGRLGAGARRIPLHPPRAQQRPGRAAGGPHLGPARRGRPAARAVPRLLLPRQKPAKP